MRRPHVSCLCIRIVLGVCSVFSVAAVTPIACLHTYSQVWEQNSVALPTSRVMHKPRTMFGMGLSVDDDIEPSSTKRRRWSQGALGSVLVKDSVAMWCGILRRDVMQLELHDLPVSQRAFYDEVDVPAWCVMTGALRDAAHDVVTRFPFYLHSSCDRVHVLCRGGCVCQGSSR